MDQSNTVLLERKEMPLDALRAQVRGSVYGLEDAGFDEVRQCWNLIVEQSPAVVVVAEGASDVQAAVDFARENGLKVSVQATGHGQPRNCQGGVLINTSRMSGLTIDVASQTARVGGGAKWIDVLNPAQEVGLAGPSGSSPYVGVVGYTLGGGYGHLLRKHGLAVDCVRSVQIVTADGQLRTASPTENADLFWALRGGGGGFGVVVEMEIALFPHAEVYGGAVLFPADRAEEVFPAYFDWTQDLPDEVTSQVCLINFPPVPFVPEPLRGKAFAMVTACICTDQATGEALMRPMRQVGPAIDTFGMMPFNETGRIANDPVDPLPAVGTGVMLKGLTSEAIPALLAAIGPMAQSANLKIELRHLGGAMGRVSHEETAIGCRREAEYLVYALGVPMGPVTPAMMEEQAERVFQALAPYVVCRGPLNFLGEGTVKGEAIRQVFGEADFQRLGEIKQALDPTNLFCNAGLGIAVTDAPR